MKKRIAITGGIGSGKSMAGRLLREMGYPVFSCDEIYKDVLRSPEYIKKIESYFSTVVTNGEIDRAKLAEIVFHDEGKRRTLNGLAHPLVMETLRKEMDVCDSNLVFAEVPLLFEGNFEGEFDCVLVIERELSERVQAVQERDHVDANAVKSRIQTQFDYRSEEGQKRIKNCNAHVIHNDGTVEALSRKLMKFIQSLSSS